MLLAVRVAGVRLAVYVYVYGVRAQRASGRAPPYSVLAVRDLGRNPRNAVEIGCGWWPMAGVGSIGRSSRIPAPREKMDDIGRLCEIFVALGYAPTSRISISMIIPGGYVEIRSWQRSLSWSGYSMWWNLSSLHGFPTPSS